VSLKVCIYAQEQPLHWIPHYAEAFRALYDTIVIGPPVNMENMGPSRAIDYLVPNDIRCDDDDALALLDHLPPDWRPDVLISIQSFAKPLRNVGKLAIPTAHISVDTWHDLSEFKAALPFDFVFCAQPVFQPYFTDSGSRRAHWSPLAYNPRCHFPVAVEKTHDITFAGSLDFVADNERAARLRRLGKHFDAAYERIVDPADVCRMFCRGKLAFNSSVCRDVNMRVFEVMGMGCPLFTNRDADVNGLLELFEDGRHLITYDDYDMLALARRYIDDDAARKEIGEAALKEVQEKHSYERRAASIIERVLETVPSLGFYDGPLVKNPACLDDWLPADAEKVADVGCGLKQSRAELRKKGVRKLIGVQRNASADSQVSGKYDDIFHWADCTLSPSDVDTVVWNEPLVFAPTFEDAFVWANEVLPAGGVLVMHVNLAAILPYLKTVETPCWVRHGFYRTAWDAFSRDTVLLVFRKFTRSWSDVATNIDERFPVREPVIPEDERV